MLTEPLEKSEYLVICPVSPPFTYFASDYIKIVAGQDIHFEDVEVLETLQDYEFVFDRINYAGANATWNLTTVMDSIYNTTTSHAIAREDWLKTHDDMENSCKIDVIMYRAKS